VGILPKLILGMWVTGAVLLTRFGTREYPSESLTGKTAGTDQAEIPPAFPKADPKKVAAEINATKAAQDLAESEGIKLASVKGTGAEGRITINDVRKALKK
jgi:pyruvate/2-oxoglutarate dehydrogenase complex dihydrolipoamide acyltransferase (E2) component